MCPGLTSPGAKLYPADSDTVVVSFECCGLVFEGCFKYGCLNRIEELGIKKRLPCLMDWSKKIALDPLTSQAIMAEGKQNALCVGVMKMSADDM